MEASEVRRIVAQAARDRLETMCQEAVGYGLTTADVVRAVLRSVMERKRGCGCVTCKARRSEVDSDAVVQFVPTVFRRSETRKGLLRLIPTVHFLEEELNPKPP